MVENGKIDENFARDLLLDYLKCQGYSGFSCEIASPDPPDLVILLSCGEKWGIEVTRVYQQVQNFKKGGSNTGSRIVPSATINAFLRRFAETLGKETENYRRCGYRIYLEGPGPFSTWKTSSEQILQEWSRVTKSGILEFIKSGRSGVHRFPGGNIKATCPGTGWRIMIGGSVTELDSAARAALRQALTSKAHDLFRWNKIYSKKYLMFLNSYPLANNIEAIENNLRRIIRDNPEYAGFDGVFWSGYPDRTPVLIGLGDCDRNGA